MFCIYIHIVEVDKVNKEFPAVYRDSTVEISYVEKLISTDFPFVTKDFYCFDNLYNFYDFCLSFEVFIVIALF